MHLININYTHRTYVKLLFIFQHNLPTLILMLLVSQEKKIGIFFVLGRRLRIYKESITVSMEVKI